MNLSRLLVVTGALAAAVSSAADDVAAQGFNDDAPAFESAWTSGYMGLGGGLVGAMPTKHHHEKKAEAPPPEPPHRRHVRVRQRFYPVNSPVALVANTLDHTGLNIANLGHVRSR